MSQSEQKDSKNVLQCSLIVPKIEKQDFIAEKGSINLPVGYFVENVSSGGGVVTITYL